MAELVGIFERDLFERLSENRNVVLQAEAEVGVVFEGLVLCFPEALDFQSDGFVAVRPGDFHTAIPFADSLCCLGPNVRSPLSRRFRGGIIDPGQRSQGRQQVRCSIFGFVNRSVDPSSINFRHSALKTAAGMSMSLTHMTTKYGHYMPDGNRRNYSSTTGLDLCCVVLLLGRTCAASNGRRTSPKPLRERMR
jgi:hypothetical protein